MTFSEYHSSLQENYPPENLTAELKALWWDGKGNWEKSHEIAQEINSSNGCWIHAYLHRKEGDIWNANYWYARAGKQRPDSGLDEEWDSLVNHFLSHS